MNILIGGAAGQGLDTVANLLSKTLAREGFGVLVTRDYMSRVRGGHNFTCVQVKEDTPRSAISSINILVALNGETYLHHKANLAENGKVVYDPKWFTPTDNPGSRLALPLEKLAAEAGGKIMANSVAVGVVLALLGLETDRAEKLTEDAFKDEAAKQNIAALRAGYAEAARLCGSCFPLEVKPIKRRQLLLDGNQTLGMSALASGCRFLSAYPMTPSTGIMNYLAQKQKNHEIVVEQAEDEIAAINMALGASFAGARSMTCTSGGGFSLMAEGLSLAGMTETPLVIILAMRPGPATGLPTRTEQGDLEFALHAGHGEFPRAIICATHLEDAFYRLNKAFDLAEKYQIPVIFLSDQYFADTAYTVPPYDFSRLLYRRYLLDRNRVQKPYRRYELCEGGISPRLLPGQSAGDTVLADSDEHDESGHIIEDALTRRLMVEKRLNKIIGLKAEMEEPSRFGPEEGDILLIGWGSTFGPLRRAAEILEEKGHTTCHLHFADLWPLPAESINSLFGKFTRRICVENNATGQFSALLRRETGLYPDSRILKFDGRPFLAEEIVREVEKNV